MRPGRVVCLVVGIAVLAPSALPQSSNPVIIDKAITKAADLLLGRNQPQNLNEGFAAFLEAVAGSARTTTIPAAFLEKIDEIKAMLRPKFEPNTAFSEAFGEAYRILSGQDYETPARLNSIAAVTQMILRQFEAASAFHRIGKREDCVRALMDAAMLIVTPIISS
jgi:hypothetical protein